MKRFDSLKRAPILVLGPDEWWSDVQVLQRLALNGINDFDDQVTVCERILALREEKLLPSSESLNRKSKDAEKCHVSFEGVPDLSERYLAERICSFANF